MNVPTWFRVTAVFVLLWMVLGVVSLGLDLMMDEAAVAALSDAQRTLYESRPIWLLAVYAIATLTGLLGAVLMLRRSARAVLHLTISLAAVTVQFGYTTWGLDAITLLGPASALTFPAVIFGLGAVSLWLAVHARAKGWLA